MARRPAARVVPAVGAVLVLVAGLGVRRDKQPDLRAWFERAARNGGIHLDGSGRPESAANLRRNGMAPGRRAAPDAIADS